MSKPKWGGKIAIYVGALTLTYALSTQIGGLEAVLMPAAVLTLFLIAGGRCRGDKRGETRPSS